MRYQPRHRTVTTTSRLLSPPALATAALVACGTTAAASGRAGSGAEPGARVDVSARTHVVASRSAGRPARAATVSRATVSRLLAGVPVPATLTRTTGLDSSATQAARQQVAGAQAGLGRSRAALVAAQAEADRAHRAWQAARAGQTHRPTTSAVRDAATATAREAARTSLTQGLDAGVSRVAAAVTVPALGAQAAVSDASTTRERADEQLTRAARAHEAARARLEQARDAATRLAAADQAAALRDGRGIRLPDGRVVASIRPGTVVPRSGHVVSPQVSAWIGEALDELYRDGFPRGATDAEDLAIIVYNESGGDPGSVNDYDSNAAAGMPSFGLMQTIGPTFEQFATPARRDRRDPVAQVVAGARYAQEVYGGLAQVPGVRSVRAGGPYLPY